MRIPTAKGLLAITSAVLLLGLANGLATPTSAQEPSIRAKAAAGGQTIRVLSYNTLNPDAHVGYPGRTWDSRMDDLVELIRDVDADVFGLQEASGCSVATCGRAIYPASELKADPVLASTYSTYPATALTGSPKVIFYRTNKFDLLDSGYRNYIATQPPNVNDTCQPVNGTSENSSFALKWVLLQDKLTAQKYFVINTHLQSTKYCWWARDQSVQQLKEEIYLKNTVQAPVIVTGDFNSYTASCDPVPASSTYVPGSTMAIVSAPYQWFDLKLDAPGPNCDPTRNANWDDATANDTSRIDYIAMTDDFTVTYRYVSKRMVSGEPYSPSDHYALFADLQLP